MTRFQPSASRTIMTFKEKDGAPLLQCVGLTWLGFATYHATFIESLILVPHGNDVAMLTWYGDIDFNISLEANGSQ